jgi:hypothetical protein
MTWYVFEIRNEESQERRFRMRTEFNVLYEANKEKFKGTALIALKPEHTTLYFISISPQSLTSLEGFLKKQSARRSEPPSIKFVDSLTHCDGDEEVLKLFRRKFHLRNPLYHS